MAYELEEAKILVVDAGKKLVEQGLIARTWGNISARVSDTQFVITPSGRAYETLTPEEIVVVNIVDCSYEGEIKPSSEKGIHAEAYRLRPQVDFVIHTHQTNASAVSILGRDFTLEEESEDKMLLGPAIPCASYGLSSTKTLKKAVARAIGENPDCSTVLMRYHGAVCMGKDEENAFRVAHALERETGRIYEKLCGEKIPKKGSDWGTRQQLKNCYAIHCTTPYIMEMSLRGKTLPPYSDDQAQIAGTSVRCVPGDAGNRQLAKAVRGRNAVLVRGKGAICIGKNAEEAEAVCMVLEKACQAANLGLKKNIPPVKGAGALVERKIYQAKYSRLKEQE